MEFNSLHFLVFFPVVVITYSLLKGRAAMLFILASSCYFYMVFIPSYILILLTTIVVDYFAAIKIAKSDGKQRLYWYITSFTITILILVIFKYAGFIVHLGNDIAKITGLSKRFDSIQIILPIGLSFHTFQSLSYVSEVYYKRFQADYDFTRYATYVMFFPQLVAGPIERPQGLLKQLMISQKALPSDWLYGLNRMVWGFLKKLCVADRLADLVDSVYKNPANFGTWDVLLVIIAFGIQIYFDFSAYTDIAIGAARCMGFRLCENFSSPYTSFNIREFWKKWHMSLSNWFKDYVYIPLGGNHHGRYRTIINKIVTFTLSGLWHGANYTFIVWGLGHGILATFSNYTLKSKWISAGLTLMAVFLLWIIFRADSVHQAIQIFTGIFHWKGFILKLGEGWDRIVTLVVTPFIYLTIVIAQKRWGENPAFYISKKKSKLVQWGLPIGILCIIYAVGAFLRPSTFIYFQF